MGESIGTCSDEHMLSEHMKAGQAQLKHYKLSLLRIDKLSIAQGSCVSSQRWLKSTVHLVDAEMRLTSTMQDVLRIVATTRRRFYRWHAKERRREHDHA